MIWAFSILTIKKSIENMIKYNNKNIGNIFIGNKQIGKVYNGSKLVWQHKTTPDYPVYPDDEIHYKSIDNNVIDVSIPNIISNQYVPELDHNVIKFSGTLTKLPDMFMYNKTDLLEFIHMPYTVTQVGNNCFDGCTNLYLMDLTSFKNVTNIGTLLCHNCKSLTEIDLTKLKNIRTTGDGFLYGCNVTQYDFSTFTEVTDIGYSFLRETPVITLDLTPISKITIIKGDVLKNCKSLEYVDLSSFTGVTSIRENFLQFCTNLEYVDLSPLSNVRTITYSFLEGCSNLNNVKFNFPNLTSIGNSFLKSCTKLEKLDLSTFTSLTSFGSGILDYSIVGDIIIDMDKVLTPISSTNFNPTITGNIYVPDHLVEEYKQQIPRYETLFKPLSEYSK